jgi:sterol desaturase/sphingolipid hydroxylase (fatty acid hydroxylase superfamily)
MRIGIHFFKKKIKKVRKRKKMNWLLEYFLFIHVTIFLFNHLSHETRDRKYPRHEWWFPYWYWLVIEFNLFFSGYVLQMVWISYSDTNDWIWSESYLMSLLKIIPGLYIVDIWFFVTHYWFHKPINYIQYHYLHHQFSQYTFPSTTFYSHPLEHILSNVGLVLVSALVTRMSDGLFGIWLMIVLLEGMRGHSGPLYFNLFNKQISIPTTTHILHHKYKNMYFGVGGFMDSLFGTLKKMA